MIVAETDFFTHESDTWKTYKISIDSPLKDEHGTDYYCRVRIGTLEKNVYGINAIQALILGVEYIKIQLKQCVDANGALYLAQDIDSKLEIEASLLSDFSKYQTRPTT